MEKTRENYKIKIAIIALSIALLLAISAIIGIWAAVSQSVSSQFTVTYDVGRNIATKVTAYYQYEGDEGLTSLGSLQQNVDGAQSGSIESPSLTFTQEKSAVRFVWLFENIGDTTFYLNYTWTDLASDVTNKTANTAKNVKWNFDGDFNGTPQSYGNFNSIDQIPTEFDKSDGTGYQPNNTFSIKVDSANPCVIVLTIFITDLNKNASITSDDNGGLSFRITDFIPEGTILPPRPRQ